MFAEIDDGGDYDRHNCCFFVCTEHGLLMNFCKMLIGLKDSPVEHEIQLNPEGASWFLIHLTVYKSRFFVNALKKIE